jgi:ketosteroid isomerase-like protein
MSSKTALAFLAGAALPAASAAALRAKVRYDTRRLMEGNPKPLLSAYAKDATLVFPGANSWGREYRGKQEIGAFLERFLAARLRGEIDEIVVNGPPWNTTVALRFNDWATDADGNRVYENRAVLMAKIAWGKIKREEVYEDTEKATAFDEHLARENLAPAVA